MKKILFLLLLACTAASASAAFRWGLTAGANFSNYHWRQKLVDTRMQTGFQGGVIGELMIPGIGFGIDLGLNYTMHASKMDLGAHQVWSGMGDVDFKMHNIDLPVHLRFKWTRMNGVENYIAPFAYAGPVFQFHVAQSKCDAIEHPAASVGINFGIGAEIIRRIQISGCYTLGASYAINTVKLDNFSARNSGWSVNVAYLF
ncbi:MAG: porin family protein [Bacteroides sp.]|nr:porin family protein [Bacteroides sp.]